MLSPQRDRFHRLWCVPLRCSICCICHLHMTQGEETWPLLLFLHGAGERGDDLELVKVHGPPKMIAQGRDFPFVVVSPQCPKDEWWSMDALHDLLNEIVETYRIDTARIYVTGLSMGGLCDVGTRMYLSRAVRGRRSHMRWWGSRKSSLNEGYPDLGFPRRERRGRAVATITGNGRCAQGGRKRCPLYCVS